MSPSPETGKVDEKAGVQQIPAAKTEQPTAPAPEPEPPTPEAPAQDAAANPGVVTLEQFVAELPTRAVPAAAMVARDPSLAEAQKTEVDWQSALDAEASQPTLPHVPETPIDG